MCIHEFRQQRRRTVSTGWFTRLARNQLDNTVYEAMMCRELLLLGRTELSCSALFSNDVSRETESRVDDADRDLSRCASSLNGESTSGRRCHSLPWGEACRGHPETLACRNCIDMCFTWNQRSSV